jgi:hypothetical protein
LRPRRRNTCSSWSRRSCTGNRWVNSWSTYIEAQKEEHLQQLEQGKLHREQVGQLMEYIEAQKEEHLQQLEEEKLLRFETAFT